MAAYRDPDPRDDVDHDTVPPADMTLMSIAGVLVALPIVALMWVGSYAKAEPKLAGFPFFIWYQFVWVFLCSACTYGAYRLVLKARPHRRMMDPVRHDGEDDR
ncbi:MAG: hypothetical protein QOF35_2339 [Actinomycetota bacterium]|nr:hypothetical protein [Actinomycetota bacterium]